MGASEEEKDRVSMEKFGCKFSELKDPQDRMSVGGTIGGNMRKEALGSSGYRNQMHTEEHPGADQRGKQQQQEGEQEEGEEQQEGEQEQE
ncbi:hypothetical protein HYH03_002856 [Edaphochlamys debaryana]|uniref:Uncharacterized protein n=1 Tax=Edaphochlamys debaryana TaxID=47281 RepID=A0A835YAU7_9CHLO|nr:hypothetical protein HYH03_002856 [Edaphochlamys debaryana]|eukprot:KAG2499278.1 hypothetical protein HYH03_002856 [Edaphochlamys debaryana]